ncbi:unnamed protein product [Meloidogyne enterolobii]|uniref:Uncharacterized protein n=1 Tax=Meloidogyne enterolobii TaxID=390850 RepID=A0ACB1AYU4_MELEN
MRMTHITATFFNIRYLKLVYFDDNDAFLLIHSSLKRKQNFYLIKKTKLLLLLKKRSCRMFEYLKKINFFLFYHKIFFKSYSKLSKSRYYIQLLMLYIQLLMLKIFQCTNFPINFKINYSSFLCKRIFIH